MRAIIILTLLIISGCASDEDMRDNFGDGLHTFTEDATGDKYVIEHHMGDSYSLKLLKKK